MYLITAECICQVVFPMHEYVLISAVIIDFGGHKIYTKVISPTQKGRYLL
jgi:hypothetical protein